MRASVVVQAMFLVATAVALPVQVNAQIELHLVGRYHSGIFAAGGAEIPAYDPRTLRAFVVNAQASAVDVLDLSNVSTPTRITSIDVRSIGASANSIDVSKGIVAVAIEAANKQAPGSVAFFDSQSLELLEV